MKVLILNKEEKQAFTKLLVNLVPDNTNYDLLTILEKLDGNAYEYAFNRGTDTHMGTVYPSRP